MMLPGGEGVLKPVRLLSFRGGGWPNSHITFIVAEKALFTVAVALFTVCVEGSGLVENVI